MPKEGKMPTDTDSDLVPVKLEGTIECPGMSMKEVLKLDRSDLYNVIMETFTFDGDVTISGYDQLQAEDLTDVSLVHVSEAITPKKYQIILAALHSALQREGEFDYWLDSMVDEEPHDNCDHYLLVNAMIALGAGYDYNGYRYEDIDTYVADIVNEFGVEHIREEKRKENEVKARKEYIDTFKNYIRGGSFRVVAGERVHYEFHEEHVKFLIYDDTSKYYITKFDTIKLDDRGYYFEVDGSRHSIEVFNYVNPQLM
jgi:hypothetical protein